MLIVSSSIGWEHVQANGSRWVREIHRDFLGVEHIIDYVAPPNIDLNAEMIVHASILETQLTEIEIVTNVNEVLN